MNDKQKYDYIIAGAGAAGLSLLWHLLHSSLRHKQFLVIDSSFDIKNDKTWCFWSKDHPFTNIVYHSWPELEVISNGQVISEKLSSFHYECIRNGDYRNIILELARQFQNVDLIQSEILDFKNRDNTAVVVTETESCQAEWIFQSVLKSSEFEDANVDISLIQHFIGWEIEVTDKSEIFTPSKATLMDFDTDQKNGLTFFYVLPFTRQRALIEYTIFSVSVLQEYEYEEAIRNYIHQRFGLEENRYQIIRKEKGIIPMEDREIPGYFNNRTLNIGTMGGATKPTTGYSFSRAHLHSQEIVDSLTAGEAPKPFSGSAFRYKVYDMMLLYLLKNEKKNSRVIFHELFTKNRIDRILEFLDERTHFVQELSIFSKLPYPPFFRAIYYMRHRIFKF